MNNSTNNQATGQCSNVTTALECITISFIGYIELDILFLSIEQGQLTLKVGSGFYIIIIFINYTSTEKQLIHASCLKVKLGLAERNFMNLKKRFLFLNDTRQLTTFWAITKENFLSEI